jgi:hypothetical protein
MMHGVVRKLRSKVPRVVLGCVVLLLLWMAGSLAIRSGLLGFGGEFDPKQVGVLVTFLGACLGTAATVFAASLTRAHNTREGRRLRLDSVIKSLESIPAEASKARLAGVLSTMTMAGHHRVALRVLKPAWDAGEVDAGTATWVIGQVLVGAKPEAAEGDETFDEKAVNEAATLLYFGADDELLTDEKPRHYYFPGHFQSQWTIDRELPEVVKELLLLTIGRMLVARDKSWWSPDGELPTFPTDVLVDCVENERLRVIRSSAAVLLAALRHRFPKEFEKDFTPAELAAISEHAKKPSVDADFLEFADQIRNHWDARPASQAVVVIAGL